MQAAREDAATSIRILGPRDAALYLEHRRRSLRDSPESFVTSPEDDLATTSRVMRKYLDRAPRYVVLGAFDRAAGEELVGSVGVHRDRLRKGAHRAYLWGLWVAPGARRAGLGARLVESALAHARSLGVERVQGSVGDTSHAALRLLERLGFRTWASEPDALRCDGASIAWCHVARELEAAAGEGTAG